MSDNFKLIKLFDTKTIKERVKNLSIEISSSFKVDEDIVVVCVMNGSVIFCSDLIRNIKQNIIFDTIKVHSYDKDKRHKLEVISQITTNLEGKNVLIVEDIIDTGNTINYLYNKISSLKPKKLKIVSFLFKPVGYKFSIKIDWIGFSIDDNFVVGYGLDYNDRLRDKKSIYKLIKEK